jgi:hypothetical protein
VPEAERYRGKSYPTAAAAAVGRLAVAAFSCDVSVHEFSDLDMVRRVVRYT